VSFGYSSLSVGLDKKETGGEEKLCSPVFVHLGPRSLSLGSFHHVPSSTRCSSAVCVKVVKDQAGERRDGLGRSLTDPVVGLRLGTLWEGGSRESPFTQTDDECGEKASGERNSETPRRG